MYLEDLNDKSLLNIELFILLIQKEISESIEISRNFQKVNSFIFFLLELFIFY